MALWLLAAAPGCASGGGEGDGEEAEGLKPVPSVVTFAMETGAVPLTIEHAAGDVDVGATVSGFYNVDLDEWACDTGTVLALDSGGLFGILGVFVVDRLQGAAWDQPRSGTLVIQQVSTGDVVTLSVNAAAGGVDLFYDDGGDGQNVLGPFTYSWEELLDLFGTSPAEYEEIASFAWAVVELARERFLVVFEVFAAIFELAPFLESIGPEANVEVPGACASLPGSGNFGDGRFVWHDVDADGLVGTGDAFSVSVQDCWVDRPGRLDSLFDGLFELSDFECTATPFFTGADIRFDALRRRVTEENGGVHTIVPDADTLTSGDTSVAFD